MKTRDEIDVLKNDWVDDPCWDIEDTDGFEDHHAELAAFNATMQKEWGRRNRARSLERAEALGLPGNEAIGRLVRSMEDRIQALESRLDSNGI